MIRVTQLRYFKVRRAWCTLSVSNILPTNSGAQCGRILVAIAHRRYSRAGTGALHANHHLIHPNSHINFNSFAPFSAWRQGRAFVPCLDRGELCCDGSSVCARNFLHDQPGAHGTYDYESECMWKGVQDRVGGWMLSLMCVSGRWMRRVRCIRRSLNDSVRFPSCLQ